MGFEIRTIPPTLLLADSRRIKIPQIPEYAGKVTGKLEAKAKELGVKCVGPCVFLYFGADGNPNTEFELVVGVPVDVEKGTAGPFKFRTTAAYRCLSMDYKGGMPGIGAAWGQLYAEAQKRGLKLIHEGREVYHKWVEFESSENLTELQIGIE